VECAKLEKSRGEIHWIKGPKEVGAGGNYNLCTYARVVGDMSNSKVVIVKEKDVPARGGGGKELGELGESKESGDAT